MMQSHVNLDLMSFVETQILPRYTAFDKAHSLSHANQVIQRSLELARKLGADIDMAYTIAAYHDLGLEGPRAIHHLTSGKILAADKRLQQWFSDYQINIMRQAVEDHRASASHEPRNIYGKIVAEADRDLNPDHVIRRTIQFSLDHYPDYTMEQHWQRVKEHLDNKYSVKGYIRLWIPGSQNEEYLKELRQLIANPTKLRARFEEIYGEEVEG